MTIAFSRRQVEDGLAPDGALMPMETIYSRVMRDPIPAFTPPAQQPISEPAAATVKPAPPRLRPGRLFLKLAYFLVRPVLRPLAWRMRTFLQRDVTTLLLEIRDGQVAGLQAMSQLRQRDTGVDKTPPTPRPPAGLRRKVHQFHAGSAHGDAITNAMFLIQRELRSLGYESEIFVEHLAPGLEQRLHPLAALPVHNDHVLLVHHSMGHDGFERVLASPAPKLLIYHNITPPALLAFNPFLQRAAALGRRQLVQLRDHVVAAIADSSFNGVELRRLGFPCVREATLLFDVDRLVARAIQRDRADAPFTVLFVGREVPSKGQADLVEAFACFAQRYQARSGQAPRLVLAGAGASDAADYRRYILARISRHRLQDSVLLTGALSDADLHGWFGAADLYVSLSRHEGFGVPLVEAMAYDIPVLALRVGAVAATLGENGVLLDDATPETVADAMMRIACDPSHVESIRQRQQIALQAWRLDRHLPVLSQMLLLAGAAPPEPKGAAASMRQEVEMMVTHHGETNQPPQGRGGLRVTIAEDAVPPKHRSGDTLALAMVSAPASLLPLTLTRQLNTGFDGVLVVSDCERRAVIESGVHIPVRVIGGSAEVLGPAPDAAGRVGRDFLHIADAPFLAGTDLLLAAWARAFRGTDGVRLVIVVPPEAEDAVGRELATLRADDVELAEVNLRSDIDWPSAAFLVQPGRGAADYLHAAQALAAGLHLIATGHGAHLAFTAGEARDVRLVRHRMRPIGDGGTVNHPHALWAEPDVQDLVHALREAHARPDRPGAAPRCLKLLEPSRQVVRMAAQAVDILLTTAPAPMRLGWVSPWGVRCGIAQYSRHLLGGFDRTEPVALFCDHRQMMADTPMLPGVKIHPSFRVGDGASLPELAAGVMAEDPDVLVIQHQAGVLPWDALAELLEHHALRPRCVVVALHNARDLLRARPALRERVAKALNACSRVLVHSSGDIGLLADIGVANGVWLPHGSTRGPAPRTPQVLLAGDAPLIGTTGFVLPHKGLQRLIQAVALLRPHWPGVRLRLVTSRYPDPVSDAELAECEALVAALGLEAQVEWHTTFAANDRVLHRLSECDLLVMPYAPTLESSSGAVRQAIASGVPTLVSDLPLFDDLGEAVDRLANSTPEAIAARIDTLLLQPVLRAALQERAQDWLADHDWSLIGERLQGMLRGLSAERISSIRRRPAYEAESAIAASGGWTPSGIGHS
jgi:glycosyltransferase involved in cell wall biosynthesis